MVLDLIQEGLFQIQAEDLVGIFGDDMSSSVDGNY